MHAIQILKDRSLSWAEIATPMAGSGEVLIKVAATAVNRADLLQRAGNYPPPPGASHILGLECAGTIEAVGEGVGRWRPGDQVAALLPGGGYAEYVSVDARHCLPVPKGLSLAEAAALPEVFITAYLNLYIEARLKAGESVFLPAGASGVGTAAIQLCKLSRNLCFVSVGTEAKLKACLELGAHGGVLHGKDDIRGMLGENGVDVILDPVTGNELGDHLSLLHFGGRLVMIGFMAGRETNIDLGRMLIKRLRLIGSNLRGRTPDEKAALIANFEEKVWPGFTTGALKPVVDKTFPIQEAMTAHDYIAANKNVGKVVLTVG